MTQLAIPPERIEDVDRAKDFLFSVMGESRWTDEKYLVFSDSHNRLVELSEGRLIVFEMPTPRHQDIVGNLYFQFRLWADRHHGKALMAPTPVRLWPGKFREPDVFLYSAEHLNRVGEQYAAPPDLVVEVLSPGTASLDLHDKRDEYARAGIPEYWIVDSERSRLEQYVLEGERYRLQAQLDLGDTVHSVALPDLVVPIELIYASA